MELKQHFTRLGALAAAGAVGTAAALAFATSAQAAAQTIEINDGNVPTTAGGYEDQSCDQVPGGPLDGQDGWVFVLPASAGAEGNFISVTATFTDGDGAEQILTTDGVDGDVVDGQGDNKAYIITPAGWELIHAEAEVEDPNEGAFFNLTHACPGEEPDDQTTPPGDETTTPVEETTSPGGDETSPGETSTSPAGGDTLPTTGAPLTIALVTAAALAAAGAAVFVLMHRRRAAQDW